jgi:glutamyl/glutaminyl-tRNA synthetase
MNSYSLSSLAIPPDTVVRLAPSPTGPFHLGNMRTAWVALKLSEKLGLKMRVRVEDIDKDRSKVEFRERQLRQLESLGYKAYDLEIQSQNAQDHFNSFLEALNRGDVYACVCSRQDLMSEWSRAPTRDLVQPGIHYSGACRKKNIDSLLHEIKTKSKQKIVWRFRSANPNGENDFIVGTQMVTSALESRLMSDFESWSPSYNWACARDDFKCGAVLGVRAWDLADVYEVQKQLVEYFSLKNAIRYYNIFHTSLVCDSAGEKLSKRNKDYLWNDGDQVENVALSVNIDEMLSGLAGRPLMGEKLKQINWKKTLL